MTVNKEPILSRIAHDMRAHINQVGAAYSYRRLAKGLEICLNHPDAHRTDRWRLAAARTGQPPSPEELEILSEAFGAHGEWVRTAKSDRHVAEIFWRQTETELA